MYCIYVTYLGREVCLTEEEFAVWKARIDGVIGAGFFERQAATILIEKGVPRGYWRSTMYYILGAIEREEYTLTPEEEEIPEEEREEIIEEEEEEIEEEEEVETVDLCKVRFEFHCRLAYCPSETGKAGHDIDVEMETAGEFYVECSYVSARKQQLIDRLESKLRFAFETFLEEQYILIYDEKYTDCGVDSFDITYDSTVTHEELEEKEEEYKVEYAVFRRANDCGGAYRRITYLEETLRTYIDEEMYDYVQEVKNREI